MASKKEKTESSKVEGTVTRVADGKVFFRPTDPNAFRTIDVDGSQRCQRAGHDEIAVRADDADSYKVGEDCAFDVG